MKDADATGGSLVEVVVGVVRANEREACAGGGSGGGSGAGKQEKEEAHECVWLAHGRRVADREGVSHHRGDVSSIVLVCVFNCAVKVRSSTILA